MNNNKQTVNLLPARLQTDKNNKFLSNTLDQFIQSPEIERIDGYIGHKSVSNINSSIDSYISESDPIQKNYQLEPAAVIRDEFGDVKEVVSFDDLVSNIISQGGLANNRRNIVNFQNVHSYDPRISWDKLVNFDQYYWLPQGPDPISISTSTNLFENLITQSPYLMPNGYPLMNGMKVIFDKDHFSTSTGVITSGTAYIVRGVGGVVNFTKFDDLDPPQNLCSNINEVFDNTPFDSLSFDNDKKLPLIPDYITIGIGGFDLNPWSRYNRWVHSEVIRTTSIINNVPIDLSYSQQAMRPIIEFQNGCKLYNFGTTAITNIDLIDNETKFPLEVIPNNLGYYIDGVNVVQGNRIIFNNADDKFVRNSVYIVSISTITNLISLSLDNNNKNLADNTSVGVNIGNINGGKSYFFHQKIFKWVESQQHDYHNQAPLFDLFDANKKSYSLDYNNSNFKGTKIFSYKIGVGAKDEILGFPIKTNSNYLGIGSIEFENNLYTDSFTIAIDNKSVSIPAYQGFLKIFNRGTELFYNGWKHELNEGFGYFTRAIEEQIIQEISTSTIYATLLDPPFELTDIKYHSILVNNQYVSSDRSISNGKLQFQLTNFEVKKTDFVKISIVTAKPINSNGYYETPLSLTSNPLNQNINTISFTELTDHLKSAFINRPDILTGTIPGVNNVNNAPIEFRLGMTKLVAHDNPISLPFLFLGTEKHNVVDALRFGCEQYVQWKSNFIEQAKLFNFQQSSSAVDAVDSILLEMSRNKTVKSLYYRSDMVPFGFNKTVREVKISSNGATEIFLEIDFNLKKLSFQAILIYIRPIANIFSLIQLVYEKDYTFNLEKNVIEFFIDLKIDDIIYIHIYKDTLGNFVPLTPSKLGLYPKYEPMIYTDYTFSDGPVRVIKGHDGSTTITYNDFRDDILLELEKRIYNNIKVEYDITNFTVLGAKPNLFTDVIRPHPLIAPYSLEEYNNTLSKEFFKWASQYNLDYTTNDTYDASNWKTWNFINSKTSIYNKDIRGSWKAIYDQFFDTIRPNYRPWECLGFSVEPNWWRTVYGEPPYSENVIQLWLDLRAGFYRAGKYIRRQVNSGVIDRYLRPDNTFPTNEFGELYSPIAIATIGLPRFIYNSESGRLDSPWQFGDWGPVETAWRQSSNFPFAANITAALLYPSEYCAKYFDISRIYKNLIGQDVYSESGKFLNPTELLIDEEDIQTSGYVNLLTAYGSSRNENYSSELKSDLKYLTFNLFYKLGGFTSKEKLQIKINAVDPGSSSPGLVLPYEDYNLQLYTSKNINSFRISGIIIEKKSEKYVLKGYDIANPYFEIYKPDYSGTNSTVSVGETQSEFTNWQPYVNVSTNEEIGSNNKKFYKQGQIVSYNGKYYRVIVSHSAGKTFDLSFFQELSKLPSEGGVQVNTTTKFEKTIYKIAYGSEFSSIQEIYDIIIGYGEYLKTKGFVFEQFNQDLYEILDWYFSGKEFLYWSTQNWDDENLIVLSPFADSLYFKYDNAVVDNVIPNDFKYSLRKGNGQFFESEFVDVSRIEGVCKIQTKNTEEGIYFAELRTSKKQHGIIFNNQSVFNDTIFDLPTGYRQERLKISGFRTKNWNGDLISPGFVYDVVSIGDWKPFKTYYPTQIVKFNNQYYSAKQRIVNENIFDFEKWSLLPSKPVSKLLPNFDYKIRQFEDFYSLDINNFDSAQQSLAQSLIGYSPRSYLSKLITDQVSQYKFYQGFIREKGTKNAIEKILKLNPSISSAIEIEEEWAFRVGSYGSYNTFNEIEIRLNEGIYFENPYIIKITDKINNNLNGIINQVTATDILITPNNFDIKNIFVTVDGNFNENNIVLNNAGYVRLDDITATAFNKNSILDIANNGSIESGNTIWLGFLENGGWTVYRYTAQTSKITGVFVSNPGSEITFVTDINHNLNLNDIISIIEFNNQVNGIYFVKSIPRSNQFTVQSTLVSIVNEPLLNYGSLFKFTEVRFEGFKEFSYTKNLLDFDVGSKVWIDKDETGKWVVLEKIKNFTTATEYKTSSLFVGQNFGFQIDANTSTVLVSSPTYFDNAYNFLYGRVTVFQRLSNDNIISKFNYTLNQANGIGSNFCNPIDPTDFGYSLVQDFNKTLFIVGAPSASLVKASTGTSYVTPATTFLNARPYKREGLVKISSKNANFSLEDTKVVLAQPFGYSNTNTRFGHSLYVNQVNATEPTMLLVGAPGSTNFVGAGNVFAYSLSQTTSSFTITNFAPSSLGSVQITTNPVSTVTISVVFSSPSLGGTTATGIVIKEGNVGTKVVITNRGSGYTSAPTVSFTATTMSTVGVASASIGDMKVEGTYTIQLNPGNRWGYAISGSNTGDTIAISAPKYFNNGKYGIVQVFNKELYWKQTLFSPFNLGDFGTSLKVSALGNYIFVGSKGESTVLNTFGKVAVYSLNNEGIYNLSQIIDNPIQNTDLIFSEAISISDDEKTLAISSLGTNKTEYVNFYKDVTERKNATIFDNGQTRFYNSVIDSGTVYIFNNFDGQFVAADELIPDNFFDKGRYGSSLVISNNSIFVGAPYRIIDESSVEQSRIYQFKKIDITTNSWKKIRIQEALTDPATIQRVALINLENYEVAEYLDVFDPIKGKIPGLADQELKYKSIVDPAIYSVGITGTIVDTQNSWIEDHVGDLWWDLSTAKFIWYEQGDDLYRKNNWGKLFPGASIDVYEWVKTSLLPSEWASIADTTDGTLKNVSGQPKYPDNSVVSVKQVLNTVTGSFENVYFYWVKNKRILPNIVNRRLTAYQVAQYISNPISNGVQIAEIISKNSIAFGNIQNKLIGDKIAVNIAFDKINNKIPRHTEWALISRGNTSTLPAILNKKLVDSLIGKDDLGNSVPDPSLSFRNKYGLSVRPRQTLFKNRFEALRNTITYANSVLKDNIIVGIKDLTNLKKFDPIPSETEKEYDFVVNDYDFLVDINTENLRQAKLSCTLQNGKIVKINILDPGFGYESSPQVIITPNDDNKAAVNLLLDENGRVVSAVIENSGENFTSVPKIEVRSHAVVVTNDINSNNRWAIYYYEYTTGLWLKLKTQLYNTTLFWDYIDYQSNDFDLYKFPKYFITYPNELNPSADISIGDYIKVSNQGDGRYLILEKVQEGGDYNNELRIVFSEKGTIKFKENFNEYPYDILTIDESLYDQLPDIELLNIITALKDDIFVDNLKYYWNELFFNCLKYALTEQKNIDWAFKTSFINVRNKISRLDTPTEFRLESSEYIEDYIREIKPFKTKIRNFVSGYEYIENSQLVISDFDMPPTYGPNYENFYVKEVIIADGGSGYTQSPTIIFNYGNPPPIRQAKASAYIRNGKVYKIVVTDPGFGYFTNVYVTFSGGGSGPNFVQASASVILGNNELRKNTIGLKFDRYSKDAEIGSVDVDYTIEVDGSKFEFELPYLANPDKSTVIPTLNKKIIFASDYDIIIYRDLNNTLKSKFVFKLGAPKAGSILRIKFQKNISLFNAVDRIEKFYNPTDDMIGKNLPLLMSGMEYSKLGIQGLQFNYSTPILDVPNIYDNGGGWNNSVQSYARKKVVNSATITTNTLFLNSIEDIVPGQILNFLDNHNKRFRDGTTVLSVNTASSSIQITQPNYVIKSAQSTSTAIGTPIKVITKTKFNTELKTNDIIELSGISSAGYNGTYTIYTATNYGIVSNNTFYILAKNTLSTTASVVSTVSNMKICSILEPITTSSKILGEYNFNIGPCNIPRFKIIPSSTRVAEGNTVTFTISGQNIEMGQGRTFNYVIEGSSGISAADFTSPMTGTTTSSTLPVTIPIIVAEDVEEPVEWFRLSVTSYITTGYNLVNYNVNASISPVVVSPKVYVDDRYITESYTMVAKDYKGDIITSVREGDVVNLEITGYQLDYGSNGKVLQIISTGSYITTSDIYLGLISPPIIVDYTESSTLSTVINIEMIEDYFTEGLERVYFNLATYRNVLDNTWTVYNTSTFVDIIDTSLTGLPEFTITASSTSVQEGSSTVITVISKNITIGSSLGFTITSLVGTITAQDIGLANLYGSVVMNDGAPTYVGYQIGTITLNIADDAGSTGYEGTEKFRLSLTSYPTQYIDIEIKDQLFLPSYGTKNVYGYAVNSETAYAKIGIRSNGTFVFDIYNQGQYPSEKPVSDLWANDVTGTENYYVRAIIQPYDAQWTGTVSFTGPGFTGPKAVIDHNYLSTVGYSAVYGDWILIHAANSTYWQATAASTTVGALAKYKLTIEISATGSIVNGTGFYNCIVSSTPAVIPEQTAPPTQPPYYDSWFGIWFNDPGGELSDARLKSDIKQIGIHQLGFGLYEYMLFDKKEQGVLAQEVMLFNPDAVSLGKDGYYRVNYNMLYIRRIKNSLGDIILRESPPGGFLQ